MSRRRNVHLCLLLAGLTGFLWAGCRKKAAPPAPPTDDAPTAQGTAQSTSCPSAAPASVTAGQRAVGRTRFDATRSQYLGSAHRPAADTASKENSADINAHITAGISALDRGDYAVATDCFYQAFRLEPGHLGVLRGLVEVLVADQKYERAVPVYEMILGLAPEDSVSRFNLAVVLSRLWRFDRAEELYRRLLDDNEEYVQARYNLATLYQAQGKLADARDAWKDVLARAPHLASAHGALAEVEMDLGNSKAAMAAYAQAAKLRPKEVSAWVNLAVASQAVGSYGRAVLAMGKAVDLAPEDAHLWAQLGEIQLQLHRGSKERKFLQDAIRSWRQSLLLDPSQKEIRDWLLTYEPALRGSSTQRAE